MADAAVYLIYLIGIQEHIVSLSSEGVVEGRGCCHTQCIELPAATRNPPAFIATLLLLYKFEAPSSATTSPSVYSFPGKPNLVELVHLPLF